jgi:hypothetical protein
VNRILRQGVGNGHSWEGTFGGGATIKIPHSNENLRLGAHITYSDRDERLFDRQKVDYGGTNLPSLGEGTGVGSFHHFTDNHPDRNGNAQLTVGYNIPLGEGWRSLHTTYEFNYKWRHRRSSLYLLDQLPSFGEGTGVGSLPSVTEYQQVMDRSNSFDSHFKENIHKLNINMGYKWDKKKYGQFWTLLDGNISLRSQSLEYQRGSIDTTLCRTAFTINMNNITVLDLNGGHQISMTLGIEEKLPDLEQRINLRDDTDPMNIRLGNTDLRTAVTPEFLINGVYRKKLAYHYLEWGYQRTYNAIAMGYVYDPLTGERTYRPENVNGNWTTDGGYTFHCSLDSTKKQNLYLPLHVTYSQSVDLVGVALLPSLGEGSGVGLSTIHHLALSLSPSFKTDVGKHHFELTCQPVWDHYTGDRQDFQNFSAITCRTSLSAILKLPWKLDLSTDLSLYNRTGYVDDALNTNDLVWNARLSRPFFKGKLLVMLDGFDILGQLDNVTRVVNAQGRTETYTNVLPRYALLHVVYRLNKQPKKKH